MFERKQFPVSANVTADGWRSTGLDWADYARMSTRQRKPSGERKLPTPKWALDDKLLQELLAEFFEGRASCGTLRTESDVNVPLPFAPRPIEERLASAQKKLRRQRGVQNHTLDTLCKKIVQEKDPQRKRALQREIEALDTSLVYTARDGGVAKIAAMVILYYRTTLDSVGVALELNVKSPHVRQTLFRLHETAKRLGAINPAFVETV
jgi:hypothetical protein